MTEQKSPIKVAIDLDSLLSDSKDSRDKQSFSRSNSPNRPSIEQRKSKEEVNDRICSKCETELKKGAKSYYGKYYCDSCYKLKKQKRNKARSIKKTKSNTSKQKSKGHLNPSLSGINLERGETGNVVNLSFQVGKGDRFEKEVVKFAKRLLADFFEDE